MTVRVLAVTARRAYPDTWLTNLRERLDLDDVDLRVLAATAPRQDFGVDITVTGEEAGDPDRSTVRGRRWRAPWSKSPTSAVPEAPASGQERLAAGCRQEAAPAALAQWAEVIVAMDDVACLGVWELSRRVPDRLFLNRAANVRPALEAAGRVPARPSTVAETTDPFIDLGVGPTLAPMSDRDRMPSLPPASTRLLIAPANYAGQARAWADAVDRHVPGARAQNFKDDRIANPYPNDLAVERLRFRGDIDWRRYWRDHVTSSYTHVIVEAGDPVTGASALSFDHDVARLRAAGLRVALLSHGTDARVPSVHAARERWAQYSGMDPEWVRQAERITRRNVAVYTRDPGPVFVSTPGLLVFVPDGVWLPVVVDPDHWDRPEPVLERARPVVAHAPSSRQKGSHHIDPVLADLEDRGLIEYRRVEGVPIGDMPGVFGTADIVIDQFGAADYGVAACEAMAAGRVVVSHVAPEVREHVERTVGAPLPIVQADPDSLRDVIEGLLDRRDEARATAAAGRAFVRQVHDGRRSAEVLAPWLAREP